MLASSKYPDRQIHRDLKEQLYYDVLQYSDQGKASQLVVCLKQRTPLTGINAGVPARIPAGILAVMFLSPREFPRGYLRAVS